MAKSANDTPLMQQHRAIKQKYPDAVLLFRVGDFYETFGEDAIIAARVLGITLTKRNNGAAASSELAGFPHHALDTYLHKLVKAGYRVAICDQLEDPKTVKGIVKRGVFLAACPSLNHLQYPFTEGSAARRMRDVVIAAKDRSGLIARHRLIEELPYFLRADRPWAEQHLLAPLLNDDGAALALWRAIARRTHFTEVLKIIGGAMAERATDFRLGRETRGRLVFSLVVEALHAFRESRAPAVPNPRIQQMLRTLDDEVRATAANAVQQFVRDLSEKRPEDRHAASAADLFRLAAAPFLRDVWPQERSLVTPGVSRALADLPAASGEAFAEAVHAIDRFLVPFECWSMLDYGLYGEEGETKKLSRIDNVAKAKALLQLLDATVGSSESAIIPHDLTDALDQIRSVAPQLVDTATYRRLSTAARR